MNIAFNKPHCVGNEFAFIEEAIQRGRLSGGGHFTVKCEEFFQDVLGCPRVLLTPSCTAALEMSALLLEIQPGDEVIVPAYTFVSTANAYALFGATIKLVDVDPKTFNIDTEAVRQTISGRTKAVVPVHYAGVSADLNTLSAITSKHGIKIVEDAAQAVGSFYEGKPLGTLGAMGAFSFHETKNIICGEGGALIINDDALVEQAEIIREKGTNRSKYFKGQVDKYTWCAVGSSYLPSELGAAYLYAQLGALDKIQQRRLTLFSRYAERLTALEQQGKAVVSHQACREFGNAHLFHLLLKDVHERDLFIKHMKEKGVLCVFHYVPLHLSDMGRQMGYQPGEFPVAEEISSRLVRLPLYVDLQDAEQDYVMDCVESFWS